MKKLMILLLSAGILLSCKSKNDPEPKSNTVELTLASKLDDSGSPILLDSTECKVYKLSGHDTLDVMKKYTPNGGKVIFTVEVGYDYYITFVSRTYKFTYNAQPHYYEYSEKLVGVNNIPMAVVAYFYPGLYTTGYGCTNYYIQDPSE